MCHECYCKNIGPSEMCKFCVQTKYLLNFHYYKFCVEEIPKWLNKFLVPLDSYLEHETLKCESFFYFWNNKVCGSLHNTLLDDMKDKKIQRINYFYFLGWAKWLLFSSVIVK